MSLVAIATAVTVLMLVASVMLGWIADLKRAGGAVSARESRAAAESPGRAFYTSRADRAHDMRERIHRERMRRERARARKAPAAPASAEPRPDRPAARPPTPEDLHRAVLDLPPGPVEADALRRQYRVLVVAYHPDRVVGLGPKLQRLAEEETKAINEAYAFFKARLADA